jgi:hypothetical protein
MLTALGSLHCVDVDIAVGRFGDWACFHFHGINESRVSVRLVQQIHGGRGLASDAGNTISGQGAVIKIGYFPVHCFCRPEQRTRPHSSPRVLDYALYIYMNIHSSYSLLPWSQKQYVPPKGRQHFTQCKDSGTESTSIKKEPPWEIKWEMLITFPYVKQTSECT